MRDLLGMTSGLNDYDDNQLLGWTVLNGGKDMGPYDLLAWANKTLTCPRVPCPGFYSSINFLLLGLIMQHVLSLAAWEDWDQMSVIFPRHRARYSEVAFPKLGRCTSYPVSHQVRASLSPPPPPPPPYAANTWRKCVLACLEDPWTPGPRARAARENGLAATVKDAPPFPPMTASCLLCANVTPCNLTGYQYAYADRLSATGGQ